MKQQTVLSMMQEGKSNLTGCQTNSLAEGKAQLSLSRGNRDPSRSKSFRNNHMNKIQ